MDHGGDILLMDSSLETIGWIIAFVLFIFFDLLAPILKKMKKRGAPVQPSAPDQAVDEGEEEEEGLRNFKAWVYAVRRSLEEARAESEGERLQELVSLLRRALAEAEARSDHPGPRLMAQVLRRLLEEVEGPPPVEEAQEEEAPMWEEVREEPPVWQQGPEEPQPWQQVQKEGSLWEGSPQEPQVWKKAYEEPQVWKQAQEQPEVWKKAYEEPQVWKQAHERPQVWKQAYGEPQVWKQAPEEPQVWRQAYEEPQAWQQAPVEGRFKPVSREASARRAPVLRTFDSRLEAVLEGMLLGELLERGSSRSTPMLLRR